MKHLKQALSLAMAAAMLVGVMAISVGAAYDDFTDQDKIVHSEAVAAMVSLGVISGKEDGSHFDPAGSVTRAEMAKLIAVTLNGGADPAVEPGDTRAQFPDAKGSWAEPYIAYCAAKGIVDGKDDGTFAPEEPVTGTGAAKMLLCALGYDSELENLTGRGWDLHTDLLADKVGLYDGLDGINPSDAMTRDGVAQMLYNCVRTSEIVYKENEGESSGVLYPRDSGLLLTNRFGVLRVAGVAVANDKKSTDAAAYKTTKAGEGRVSVTAVSGFAEVPAALSGGPVFPLSLSDDMLGREIVIFVQFADNQAPVPAGATVVGAPVLTGGEAA